MMGIETTPEVSFQRCFVLKGTPQLGAKRELERGTNYYDTEWLMLMAIDSRVGVLRRIPRL